MAGGGGVDRLDRNIGRGGVVVGVGGGVIGAAWEVLFVASFSPL